VAVVSYAFWEQRLQGDVSRVGKELMVQNQPIHHYRRRPGYVCRDRIAATKPRYLDSSHGADQCAAGVDWLHDRTARELQILRAARRVSREQATAELEVLGRAWPSVENKQIYLSAKKGDLLPNDSGEFETLERSAGSCCCGNLILMIVASTWSTCYSLEARRESGNRGACRARRKWLSNHQATLHGELL